MKNFSDRKPRICIALPGTDYVPHAPLLFANTYPLLPYLEQDFEVTVAFRKNLEQQKLNYNYLTILESPQSSAVDPSKSIVNFSPTGFWGAWKYYNSLRKFAKEQAQHFDLILERQWSLVGALANLFYRHQVPSIFVMEAEFYTTKKSKISWQKHPIKQASTSLFKLLLPKLRKQWIHGSNGIIVETEQMRSFLLEQGYIDRNTNVYSIPNGIDTKIFYPRDRQQCRQQLGIDKDCFVLTYLGSLNRFIQEPRTIIEALGRANVPNIILYMIGDGMKRQELENIADRFNARVIFIGRLKQQEASQYIGAANLCIAPYNKTLFPQQKFTSASLKVCEYLASGRLVLTIPCERMEHLLSSGSYGFLVENEVESYKNFFKNRPDLDKMSVMERKLIDDLKKLRLKEKEIVLTWEDIAEMYKTVIKNTLDRKK